MVEEIEAFHRNNDDGRQVVRHNGTVIGEIVPYREAVHDQESEVYRHAVDTTHEAEIEADQDHDVEVSRHIVDAHVPETEAGQRIEEVVRLQDAKVRIDQFYFHSKSKSACKF